MGSPVIVIAKAPRWDLSGRITEFLSRHSLTFERVASVEAAQYVRNVPLVIFDEQSVETPTVEAVKEIRRSIRPRHIAVLTDQPRPAEMVKALIGGADLYLRREPDSDLLDKWWSQPAERQRSGRSIVVTIAGLAITLAFNDLDLDRGQVERSVESAVSESSFQLASSGDVEQFLRRSMAQFLAQSPRPDRVIQQERAAKGYFDRSLLGEFGFGGQGVDPTSIRSDPGNEPSLYWNSRFPENRNILRAKPGRVFVSDVEIFETGLDNAPMEKSETTPIPGSEKLVGTDVVFDLLGTGVSFATEGAEGPFATAVTSRPLPCGATGTDPFRVFCRIDQVGPLLIEGRLSVRGNRLLGQDVPLFGYPVGEVHIGSAVGPGDGTIHPGVVDPDAMVAAPDVDLGLDVRSATGADEDRASIVLRAGNQRFSPARSHVNRATLIAKAMEHRAELARLSGSYRPAGGGTPFALEADYADQVKLGFARIGSDLHQALFGTIFGAPLGQAATDPYAELQAVAIAKQGRAGSRRPKLQIEAPRIPIPWALLYDGRAFGSTLEPQSAGRYQAEPRTAADVDVECFWGYRMALSHYVNDVKRIANHKLGKKAVRVQPVLNPDLEGSIVKNQHDLFIAPSASAVHFDCERILTDRSELLMWVGHGKNESCDILYLFCHASAASEYDMNGLLLPVSDPESRAWVEIGDQVGGNGRVTVSEMKHGWPGMRNNEPLVFLNACSTAQTDPLYGTPFVDHFLTTWQGRALVGTEWPVPGAFADEFSRLVIAELRGRKPLIDALGTAAGAAFEQGNLFPLIYTLYGVAHLQA